MNREPIRELPDVELSTLGREGLIDPIDDGIRAPHDSASRVELCFTPSGRTVRVPSGVSVFDAASWNGIAIDSTCGGHGTCKKCKVKVLDSAAPIHRLDHRSFSPDHLAEGWRLACLAHAIRSVEV